MFKFIFVSLFSLLVFVGCSDVEQYNSPEDNHITHIGNNVYLKHIIVDGYNVFVYTDKNGNPFEKDYQKNTPISTNYTSGKAQVSTTTLPVNNEDASLSVKQFVFECNDLKECEQNLEIAKKYSR